MSHENDLRGLGKVDFAQFLLDRALISQAYAAELRDKAENGRMPIGQILIRKRFCSVRQIMDVVALQAECPSVRFGELAVRCKYISTVELQESLAYQRKHRQHQIEVAYFGREIPRQELHVYIVGYVRLMELQSMEVDDEVERSFAEIG